MGIDANKNLLFARVKVPSGRADWRSDRLKVTEIKHALADVD